MDRDLNSVAGEYVDALGKGLLNSWERKLSHFLEGHCQCPGVCRIRAYAWLAASYLSMRCSVVHVALYFPVPCPPSLHSFYSSGSGPWKVAG